MQVFKCKMCGGDLNVDEGMVITTCGYCGSTMTLPRLDDGKIANLFDRGNHYRRSNEYDKALAVYEAILNEDNTNAEAHWSVVLCRYGIEYVEDPTSHKRIPTCNRAQLTSILSDPDFQEAIKHSDAQARYLYEEEAKVIDKIQKDILAISSKEEPFDIFISYKETDQNGRRTKDSVLAQEIYFSLTQEGYKVFFSRITLEKVLGSAYEPYIFAALHSSKIMIVVGTQTSNLNSPWVKNEWGRYLTLIKSGAKKTLIPAYKDMDPYDLPEEFSHLQALDMNKLGFMQDLTLGIKKMLYTKSTTESTNTQQAQQTQSEKPLVTRGFMFLEDGNWAQADSMFEQALNINPENGEAYLGKLLQSKFTRTLEELKNQNMNLDLVHISDFDYKRVLNKKIFDDDPNYKKAIRFLDPTQKQRLSEINDYLYRRYVALNKVSAFSQIVGSLQRYDNETEIPELTRMLAQLESTPQIRKIIAQLEEIKIHYQEKKKAEQFERMINSNPLSFNYRESFEKNIDLYLDKLMARYPDNSINIQELYSYWNENELRTRYTTEKNHKLKVIENQKRFALVAAVFITLGILLSQTVLKSTIDNYFAEIRRKEAEAKALEEERISNLKKLWNGSYFSDTYSADFKSFRVDIMRLNVTMTRNGINYIDKKDRIDDPMSCTLDEEVNTLTCGTNNWTFHIVEPGIIDFSAPSASQYGQYTRK